MPVLAVDFDDDLWATPDGIDRLVGQLVNCNVEWRQVIVAAIRRRQASTSTSVLERRHALARSCMAQS
ncbi:hypothetical protein [Rhodoferax ferrireducens]|uniref:hypothetical protein n=1 Tax=Rhodoferax ferrireducens TaxID=192843 RepID=UPI001300BCAA|nr:hypothetical protein [Rhodoferax ferrireducens]